MVQLELTSLMPQVPSWSQARGLGNLAISGRNTEVISNEFRLEENFRPSGVLGARVTESHLPCSSGAALTPWNVARFTL